MPPAGADNGEWTPAGRAALRVASLAGVLGVVTRDRVLLTVAIVLGAVLVLAAAALRRDISVLAEITPPACVLHRGGTAELAVRVINTSSRVARRLSIVLDASGKEMTQSLPRLRPTEAVTQIWVVPTPSRGDHDFGPVLVERTEFMRLRRRVIPAGHAVRVRVYPAEHYTSRVRTSNVSRPGAVSESSRLGSDSFRSIRPYVRGDDVRHVHWRTTARKGRLMVREFVELEARHVAIYLDDRPKAMTSEDFDEAVDVAASLVTAAVDASLGVDVATATERRTAAPGRSAAHVRDFLACVQQAPASVVSTPDITGRVVITGTTRVAIPAGAVTTIVIDSEGGQDASDAIRRWNGGVLG